MELKAKHYIAIGTGLAIALNWKSITSLFDGKKKLQEGDFKTDDVFPIPTPKKAFPIYPSSNFNQAVQKVQQALLKHNPESRQMIQSTGGADGIYAGGTKQALAKAGFNSNSISKQTYEQLMLLLQQKDQLAFPQAYAQQLYKAFFDSFFFVDTKAVFEVFRAIPNRKFNDQVELAYTQNYGRNLPRDLKDKLSEKDYLRIGAMLNAKSLSGHGCNCNGMYAPMAMNVVYMDHSIQRLSKGELIGKLIGVQHGIAAFERPDGRIAAIKFN